MRKTTLAFALLTTSLSAQVQWRRFAPTADFEPTLGAVAFDPISGFGYYAGLTATATSGETWRHVDGTWQRITTATPLPVFPVASAVRAAATWPGHGILYVAAAQTWLFDGTNWSQVAVPSTPFGLSSMAFDEARQVMVAIAQLPSGGVNGAVEFNGVAWHAVVGNNVPLSSCKLAWCALTQRVVLVGSNLQGRSYWSWDGSTWTNQLFQLGTGAPGFALAAAPGGSVLLSGGWDGTFSYGNLELWAGGATPGTTPVGGPAPPWRKSSLSWFDSVQQRTVVTSFEENWTTWTWNGSTWAIAGAGEQPTSSDNVAYDSWRGELLMAGGWATPSNEHSDLWARRGTQWTRIATGPFAPRRYASVAFDSARGRLVMIGGATHDSGAGAYFTLLETKTWEWDGGAWLDATPPLTPGSHPSPRHDAAIAFDRQRGRTVLFGGRVNTGGFVTTIWNDTWEWDGTAWTLCTPAMAPLTGTATPSMTFDSATGRCWLFAQQSLWSWDGTNWTFEESVPISIIAPQRLADDPTRGLVLLAAASAWRRQGPGAWVPLAARANEGRPAFDLARGALVGTDQRATFELGDPAAAIVEPIGAGCAGTNGVPVLHGEQPPRLGTTLPLRVERMPANGLAVGLLGADTGTWLGLPLPLDVTPLGLTGCVLGTPIDVTVTLLSPDWSIPLPAFAPSLVGASFRAQVLVLDPPANPFGAVLSNTLRLRAGA